jgi:hypothetical protein
MKHKSALIIARRRELAKFFIGGAVMPFCLVCHAHVFVGMRF